MAGSYPDPPAPRMAYDRDGTQLFRVASSGTGTPTSSTQAQLTDSNRESGTGPGNWVQDYSCFIFPELRDMAGIWALGTNSGAPSGTQFTAQVSVDTTNGVDGTWTTYVASFTVAQNYKPSFRNNIAIATATGVKAVRVRCTNAGNQSILVHLYGTLSATSERLEFWHPTLDQPLNSSPAHLDWGNRARSTTQTRQFRIKNISSIATANTITVGVEALTDASPTYVSQHQISYNGGAYGATASISSLAPGAISAVCDIQQALTSTAALGLWNQRVYANAGSWT